MSSHMYNTDFTESTDVSGIRVPHNIEETSVEDLEFLQMMEQRAKKFNIHY